LRNSATLANVSLLGSDAKLRWEHNGDGLRINLPREKPGVFAYAFKIPLN
jgi:hypothetical protein